MSEHLVDVEGLTVDFELDRHTVLRAVNDVSFHVSPGETLGVVGESGSGKTTVGRSLLGLIEPTAGQISFKGRDMRDMSARELRTVRQRTQVVFQDHFGALNPRWRVGRIIEEPLLLAGELGPSDRAARVHEMLDRVGLSTRLLESFPLQLTASQQQRVAVARGLISHPDLVVLDEPTSNLDPTMRAAILTLLTELQREFNTAYILISHDLTAVEEMSARVAVMYLGRLVEVGETASVLTQQRHPYSKALLASVLYPDPKRRPGAFTLSGEIPTAINQPDQCPLVDRCPMVVAQCRTAFPPYSAFEEGHLVACYRAAEVSGLEPVGLPVQAPADRSAP